MWWTLLPAATAADIAVGLSPLDDFDNLPDAVAAATPGDRLLLGPITFVTDPLVIAGLQLIGAPATRIEPTSGAVGPVLTLRGDTRLETLTVSGAGFTRAVAIETGAAHLVDMQATDGAAASGGNLHVAAGASLLLEDSLVRDGEAFAAEGRGGGLWLQGAATVRRSAFVGNAAASGGGIYAALGATLTIEDSDFESNEVVRPLGQVATGAGISSDGTLAIHGARFVANLSSASAAAVDARAPVELFDVDFLDNRGRNIAALEIRGAVASEPSELRRLRFCGNGSGEATRFSPALRVSGPPLDASNLLFRGTTDAIVVAAGSRVDLRFATWIGQFSVDGAPGSALRVEGTSSVTVEHSLLQDVLGQAFTTAATATFTSANLRTHQVSTPPAGSSPLDPAFDDPGGCGWPVPTAEGAVDVVDAEPDPDGTPGTLGATGGPWGPPEVYPDTDGDGWSDGREALEGTDPLHPDTDRDGAWDSVDPDPLGLLGPNPVPPPEPSYGVGCRSVGLASGGLWLLALVTTRRRAPTA